MRASILAIAAALTLAVLPAAPAGAGTIGADLNRPADATFGCETLPTTDAFGGKTLASAGVSLASGAGGSAKSKLTAAGRKLMAGRKRRRVWLNVTVTLPDGGKALVSSRITLRR